MYFPSKHQPSLHFIDSFSSVQMGGQFAIVYHCRHRITGEEFAAKFSSRWRLGADCTADIIHEVAVCAMLKPTHRTIQLHDVFSTDTELVLVME
ncbi:Serine/threonine-protein kinase 17A [Halocaridina rubra]|uniref:Serine/threonine-protein kinase 17A n=1 Tax=Halocaridina rubra TaxID=373956 RepID=A0AAN9A5V6_HALRR